VSLASGYSFDKIDRKYSILVGFYTVFVIGGILQATSTIFAQMYGEELLLVGRVYEDPYVTSIRNYILI
ncbi:1633_t:CDS:1, partial [Rhizophagus irregularis]